MRLPKLISVLAVSLAGALTLTAAPASAAPTPANPGSMPGMSMDHAAMATVADKPRPDSAAGLARARQKVQYFAADLRGANEVPGAGGRVGDKDGRATGLIRLQGNRVTYAFAWKNISAPSLGHIHEGKRGVNGAVVVPLFATAMPATITAAAGVATVDDAAVADRIRQDPSGFYLNLHTGDFPGGAVRGQLRKLNGSRDVLTLLHAGALKAFMSGGQEVPVKDGPKAGDRHGFAVGFVDPRGSDRVDFAFSWVGIDTPTLGHVHRGKRGVNGDVVVPLFTTALPEGVFGVAGSVNGTDPAVVRDIRQHPSGFYANLHTGPFPGGAVRGQLFSRH